MKKKKRVKRFLAFVLTVAVVLGMLPYYSSVSNAEEPETAAFNETVMLSDTFDAGTSWNTTKGNWRLSNEQYAGTRNGTAPLGYNTISARNLYSGENDGRLADVHIAADVCVTSAVNYGDHPQYHFLLARASSASAADGIVFGLKTLKGAAKSSLVVCNYDNSNTPAPLFETKAIYEFNTAYRLELFVVGNLVVAKCDGETIFADTVEGINTEAGYCGIIDRRASSKASTSAVKGGYFDNFSLATITFDGFRVNGSIVADKEGNGVADISILSGGAEVTDMDDATVTVQTTDVGTEAGNLSSGLNQGGYLITLKKELPITSKTAKADTVYVVSDLAEAVTSMADSRWTGNTVTAAPKFSVDGSGKATLVASPTALAALSMLNAGENGEGYGDFYVEYTLTMSKLPTEKNNYFDQFLCMDSYGTTDKNAWDAALFFDTRASQAPKKTFWARLRTMPNTEESFTKNYSDTFADPDIGEGLPMKVGMLVYDSTVTLIINGEEAVSYTGTTEYRGWFGIWLGNTTATAMIENFIYVPLGEKKLQDIEFLYPGTVTPGKAVEVSAIPVYNWPYGKGEAITEGIVVSGLDTSTVGEKTFTASYNGIEKRLSLVVSNTMFEENFDGTLLDLTENGWGDVNNTTAALSDKQLSLSGMQEALYLTELVGSEAWTDYTVRADVKMVLSDTTANTSFAAIVARSSGKTDGYEWALCLEKSGAAYVRLYDRAAGKILFQADYPVDLDEVYTLKMTVAGDAIKCYVNDEKILETKAVSCSKGTVGVRRNGYMAYYDNMVVTLPEEDTAVEDITKRQIWFTDTFESETAMSERGWSIDGKIMNGRLILGDKQTTAFLTGITGSKDWTDYTAQADVTVTKLDEISPVGTNVAALVVRSSNTSSGYEFGVTISSSTNEGGFRLYNRTTGEILASSTAIKAVRGQTYRLTVVAEGNRIRCLVDGTMIFDVTDASNQAGYVGLRTGGYSGAYDNIVVRKVTDADRKGFFSTSRPKTGDETMPIYILILIMLVAALTAVEVYRCHRFGKKYRKEEN